MGSLCSVCKRRSNTLTDLDGMEINVEEDFDKFNESDLLMDEDQKEKRKNRPPTPHTKKKKLSFTSK